MRPWATLICVCSRKNANPGPISIDSPRNSEAKRGTCAYSVLEDSAMSSTWGSIVVLLVLVASATPLCFVGRAPEGFEDEQGFHLLMTPPQAEKMPHD